MYYTSDYRNKVDVVFESALEKAKIPQNWNKFSHLVRILVKLERQGYPLSDKIKRNYNTQSFIIKEQALELKPKYLEKVEKKIRKDLKKEYTENSFMNVQTNLEIMSLFNRHHLYFPNKKDKIDIGNYLNLILQVGVHSHLDNFKNNGDMNLLSTAEQYCHLTGRNFAKELERYYNIPLINAQSLTNFNSILIILSQ